MVIDLEFECFGDRLAKAVVELRNSLPPPAWSCCWRAVGRQEDKSVAARAARGLAQTSGPTVGRRWIRRMVAALRVNQPESRLRRSLRIGRLELGLLELDRNCRDTYFLSCSTRSTCRHICSACASPSDAGPAHAGPAIASPLAGRSREPVPAEAPAPASPPHRWSGGNAPPTQGRGDARNVPSCGRIHRRPPPWRRPIPRAGDNAIAAPT